jgi:homoserine dehydrogenase
VARGDLGAPFSVPVAGLEARERADAGHRTNRTYLRFTVADRPGVLAEIATAMRDAGVSIESLIQQGRPEEGGEVLIAMVTHEGPEANAATALRLLEGSASLTEPPLVMRLLD